MCARAASTAPAPLGRPAGSRRSDCITSFHRSSVLTRKRVTTAAPKWAKVVCGSSRSRSDTRRQRSSTPVERATARRSLVMSRAHMPPYTSTVSTPVITYIISSRAPRSATVLSDFMRVVTSWRSPPALLKIRKARRIRIIRNRRSIRTQEAPMLSPSSAPCRSAPTPKNETIATRKSNLFHPRAKYCQGCSPYILNMASVPKRKQKMKLLASRNDFRAIGCLYDSVARETTLRMMHMPIVISNSTDVTT
mmetsp:Transcript_27691/g.68460  ORF Transcript_27691/g.68460 Transcript_27691/m.68460 type:complete len:250 (-) Transcript_27691:917-1666(-)